MRLRRPLPHNDSQRTAIATPLNEVNESRLLTSAIPPNHHDAAIGRSGDARALGAQAGLEQQDGAVPGQQQREESGWVSWDASGHSTVWAKRLVDRNEGQGEESGDGST